jgi:high affinity sulfate transporter 1
VAIGRTFAAIKDYQLDGNKEMVALGTMNIVGSMTSCYVTTGSSTHFLPNRDSSKLSEKSSAQTHTLDFFQVLSHVLRLTSWLVAKLLYPMWLCQ